MRASLILVFSIVSCIGNNAFGDVLSYSFTGTFLYVSTATGTNLNSVVPLSPNDLVTGTLDFDPSQFQDGTPDNPERGGWFYNGAPPVPSSLSFSIGGYTLQTQPNSNFFFDLSTADVTGVAPNTLNISVNSNVVLSNGWSATGSPNIFMSLGDPGGRFFPSKQITELPVLSKADLPDATLSLRFSGSPATLSFGDTHISSSAIFVVMNIDSLTVVPEPSTFILGGLAAVCLALWGKPRRAGI